MGAFGMGMTVPEAGGFRKPILNIGKVRSIKTLKETRKIRRLYNLLDGKL
jgi:hypothetical protein